MRGSPTITSTASSSAASAGLRRCLPERSRLHHQGGQDRVRVAASRADTRGAHVDTGRRPRPKSCALWIAGARPGRAVLC